MENIKIFEKHFRKGMINKDFNSFKRTHPTLLKCIINAMDEVSNKIPREVPDEIYVQIARKQLDTYGFLTQVDRQADYSNGSCDTIDFIDEWLKKI